MPEYDLNRLNNRSFEQLVQALAVDVFGPGLVVFGDGPDGGREATFDFKVPYPSEVDEWDGYCVVQAKFLQRPKNTYEEGNWAVAELKSELEKYVAPDSVRKIPEYYLFVTNVVLSPVQEKGAKDRASALLEEYQDRLLLKGFDIWDYDKLRVFLDNNTDVRQANEAWITTGDVLASITRRLDLEAHNFVDTITGFLEKELLNDQFVNIEQAGHRDSDGIPLAQVFVDLETVDEVQALRLVESQQTPQILYDDDLSGFPKLGFIREIVDLAAERLDYHSLEQGNAGPTTSIPDSSQVHRGRFVLIGGPGQGKSTIGQFICQIFRASIVSRRTSGSFLPETSKALSLIQSHCENENINYNTVARFPFRVILSQFATALSADSTNNVSSVFSYLSYQIGRRTGDEVSIGDLKRWLSKYPAIVIFDGLDEVPSSSNRDQVLEAIRDFWVDVSRLDADVLGIATSRPQGYNNEFSPAFYRHRWLAPLTNQNALQFGRRLAEVRYSSDVDRRDKVLERLKRAIDDNSTSRLMRSPLQVTIMTALVDQMGRPPSGRWNLFDSYYEVIYQREMERDIPASELLRQYRPDIDAIHNRVGLLLQIASEQKGKTDAWFSGDKIRSLVKARLEEEGHEGIVLDSLTDQIANAALERLVFLVGVEADQVGFEIRSFQEFMAAECLMDGSDAQVELRLREIAPLATWRNVFLFAAGKIFSKKQPMRGIVSSFCSVLNDMKDDKVAGTYLAGTDLALSLLEDGLAQNMPNYTRSFSRTALRALDLPSDRWHLRLASVYHPDFRDAYVEELSRRLNDNREDHRLGAWCCLRNLIDADVKWAQGLAEEFWPSEPVAQFKILSQGMTKRGPSWDSRKLVELMPSIAISRLQNLPHMRSLTRSLTIGGSEENSELTEEQVAMMNVVRGGLGESRFQINLLGSRLQHSAITSISYDESLWLLNLQDLVEGHPSWSIYKAAGKFLSHPCKQSLAEQLRAVSSVYYPEIQEEVLDWNSNIPWPLLACLKACTDQNSLTMLANKAQCGELGDIDQWRAAELRWLESGVTAKDIVSMSDDRLPFDQKIDIQGFPVTLPILPYLQSGVDRITLIGNLLDLHGSMDDSESRRFVARAISLNLIHHALTADPNELVLPNNLSLRSLQSVYEDAPISYIPLSIILELIGDVDEGITEFFASISRVGKTFQYYGPGSDIGEEKISRILKVFAYASDKASLLPPLEALSKVGLLNKRSIGELSSNDFEHADHKVAAFVVSLAQESWLTDRSTLLKEELTQIAGVTPDAIDRIILTLMGGRFSGPRYDEFVAELATVIPIHLHSTRALYWNLLEDSLGRRTSNLGDLSAGREFEFSPKLIELLVD